MTQRYLKVPSTERILPPLGYFHMRIMNPDNLLNNWHTQIIPLKWNESIRLPEVHVQVLLADSCQLAARPLVDLRGNRMLVGANALKSL